MHRQRQVGRTYASPFSSPSPLTLVLTATLQVFGAIATMEAGYQLLYPIAVDQLYKQTIVHNHTALWYALPPSLPPQLHLEPNNQP
jgi:hypothetical protein